MAKQKTWLDSLQALSIIALVTTHVLSLILYREDATINHSESSFSYLLIQSITLFAYPMILMVSGVSLLSREYELKSYYKHRFLRIASPLLTWLIIYAAYFYISTPSRPTDLIGIFTWIGKLFVEQSISPHLWFAIMLVILFTLAPFLGSIVRNLKPSMLYFLLGAWVLIANISNNFYLDYANWSEGYLVKAVYYFVYSGYMVLGYAIYNLQFASKNIRISAWIIFAVSVLIPPFMAYYSSKMGTKLINSYYHSFNLNTIIQVSALFLALKETYVNSSFIRKIQDILSDYLYGIYLAFVLIAELIIAYCIECGDKLHPLFSTPILTILTLFFTVSLLFVLRKLSFGRYFSG